MTEQQTETRESPAVDSDSPPADPGMPPSSVYLDAIEEYLEAEDWLGPADAPLKVHARSIARSLDRQLDKNGEVQSALASSFDKVLLRLDRRRPPPAPRPPALGDDDGQGTPSMFGGFLPG